MASCFSDPPLIEDDDLIGVSNRRKPMGDDEDRPPCHQSIHALLDNRLGVGVDRAGRLIQHEYRWVGDDRPSDRDQLPLSL